VKIETLCAHKTK